MISQDEMRQQEDRIEMEWHILEECLGAFGSERLPTVVNTVYALPEKMLASGFFDVEIKGKFCQCPRCGARIFDIVEQPVLDNPLFYKKKNPNKTNRSRLEKLLFPDAGLSPGDQFSRYHDKINEIARQYDYSRVRNESYSAVGEMNRMCPYCCMSAKTGNVFGSLECKNSDTEVVIVGETSDYKAAIQTAVSRITEDVEISTTVGELEFKTRYRNDSCSLSVNGISWAQEQADDIANRYIQQVDVPATQATTSVAQNIKKDSQSLAE